MYDIDIIMEEKLARQEQDVQDAEHENLLRSDYDYAINYLVGESNLPNIVSDVSSKLSELGYTDVIHDGIFDEIKEML